METKKIAGRYFKLYFYFIIFFLPLVFIQKCEDAYYMPKLVIFTGGLQFYILAICTGARKNFKAIDWTLAAFTLLYPAGIISAPEKISAVIRYLEWVSSAGIFFFARHFLDLSDIKKSVFLMLSSAVLVSGYAFLQSFSVDLSGWATNFSGRSFSSLGNPDFLGGFLVTAIPLVLFEDALPKARITSPAILVFLSTVLVLSQTRSSLAAFFVSLAIMAFMAPGYFKAHIKILAAGVVIAVLIVIASGTVTSLAHRVAPGRKIDASGLQGRADMWSAGIKMIKGHVLIGAGAGNINNIYPLYAHGKPYIDTDHLHNDFIEIFAESGIFAFGSFMIFLGLLAAALAGRKDTLSKAALASAAAMAVQSMFNFPFYIPDSKLYFFAVMGLALSSGFAERIKPSFATAAAALLTAAAVVCSAVFLSGSVYLNRVINSASFDGSAGEIEKAVALYPGSKKYYYTAEAYLKAGRPREAYYYSSGYTAVNPFSKNGAIQAGIIKAETGDLNGALKTFGDFLDRYPDDVYALNNTGKLLFMMGKSAESVGTYRKVIGLSPENELAHQNLYSIFTGRGMKKEAADEMKRWDAVKEKINNK
jgi:O-antigen ligase